MYFWSTYTHLYKGIDVIFTWFRPSLKCEVQLFVKKNFFRGYHKRFYILSTSYAEKSWRNISLSILQKICQLLSLFWQNETESFIIWFYSLIFFYKFTKMSDNAPPALLEYAHLKMVSKCCGLKTTWWIKHQRMKYGIFPVSILMHVIMKATISVAN